MSELDTAWTGPADDPPSRSWPKPWDAAEGGLGCLRTGEMGEMCIDGWYEPVGAVRASQAPSRAYDDE